MRRPLVVLAAGFVLGEVLALQEQVVWVILIAAAVSAVLMGAVMAGSGGSIRRRWLWGALAALAFAAGFGRAYGVRRLYEKEAEQARQLEEVGLQLAGRVAKVQEKEERWTILLKQAAVRAGKRNQSFSGVLVYWDKTPETGARNVYPGQRAVFTGRISEAEPPANPGEFHFAAYCRAQGAACSFFAEQLETLEGRGNPYFSLLGRVKDWCRRVLREICEAEDAAVYEAILLGDTSAMPEELKELYQRNGISHLLAISGQHLTILGGGIYLLLRRSGLGFRAAGLAGGCLVISYGCLTGSSGSAMRAVVMILCLWLAAAEGRSYDTLSALGLAALLLLGESPYLVTQGGVQLSFGAAAAIGGLGTWLREGLAIRAGWQRALLISFSVQLVITPILLWQFYQYPLYGILLNLLVAPLVAGLMYSGLLVIGIGGFWRFGGILAAGSGHFILRYYEWLCGRMTELPYSSLLLGRPGWGSIILYGLTSGGMLWALVRMARRGREDRERLACGTTARPSERKSAWRSGWTGVRGLGAVAVVYGVSCAFLIPGPVRGLDILCLDVGQGDGFLLRTGRSSILIDGGSSSAKRLGEQTLEPCLKSLGISRVDAAVVSHGDADHISGIQYLLEQSTDITVECLVMPAAGRGSEPYETLERLACGRGGRVRYLRQGECLEAGGLTLSCMFAGGAPEGDRNSHSLVLCADYGEFHMLFTGDMGEKEERELLRESEGQKAAEGAGAKTRESRVQAAHLDHVQVLKLAHHGSAGSSCEEFLNRLKLKLAVVSYGEGNSYGHPAKQVVERMELRRIPLLETGKGGAIHLWTDGAQLKAGYQYPSVRHSRR